MQPIVLVGPELEENLSLRYLAAMVEGHGFHAELVVWSDGSDIESAAKQIAGFSSLVVGLSVPSQLYAAGILELSNVGLLAERGIYRAEVVMDYGPDVVAFDALSIEVL